MGNYEVSKKYLEDRGAFSDETPKLIDMFADAIPFPTVPYRMKATIAVSEIITFASQFRRNVQLQDKTEVPVNSIGFVLTGSGQNKDSSVRYARKALKPGYELIEETRKQRAITKAIEQAEAAGEEFPDQWESYKSYYRAPPPIFLAPTTMQGLVRHANDLNHLGLGASLIYTGEFGDQLAHGETMIALIEALSELYDLGEKEARYTQGADTRSDAVSGQPVSALMVGSPTYILYDEPTKKKFNISFMSKLARRAWFCFVSEVLEIPEFNNPEDLLAYKRNIASAGEDSRLTIKNLITGITEYALEQNGEPLPVVSEVTDLFEMYHVYNNEYAKKMANPDSAAVLVRKHLQWKALKLAGAFAIFDCADTVTTDHYIAAIRFCEILSEDMQLFEAELSKFNYERFADFIKTRVNAEGIAHMSVHDIKKMGFVSSTTKHKLQEFISLAATYDKSGVYSLEEDATVIQYAKVIETDDLTLSFKPIDNTRLFRLIEKGADKEMIKAAKSNIAKTAQSGYEVGSTTFKDLGVLLQGDFAYSPFVYRDNIRGHDNIISGTKFIVFDIDDSTITAEEAHFMLSDINHHIALGSDPNNQFKFRVIVELDSVVKLDALVWHYFYQDIANELSLSIDVLPQSQIFFSYSSGDVLSVTDQSPIHVRDYVMEAKQQAKDKPKVKTYTTKEKQALIDDEYTTFMPAFEATNGEGSRKLVWAAKYAVNDLGMSPDDAVELVKRINSFWLYPMNDDRLEHTILSQIRRW